MKVTPRSVEELDVMREEALKAFKPLEPGIYNFQVINAEAKKSKNGHEMIELQLCVWDRDGKERMLKDWLLDAMAFKMRHFAEGAGLLEKYNLGEVSADDCFNRSGKVDLIIQKGKPKDNGDGNYPDRNSVKDYVTSGIKPGNIQADKIEESFFDDDVPF